MNLYLNKDIERIANAIADESVIAYTLTTILSPEEAFRLNNVVFECARAELVKEGLAQQEIVKKAVQL